MKKKLMAIAMTAAMVGSLTACGGGAKETTAAPTEAAKTEAAETEAKAEESKEAVSYTHLTLPTNSLV